MKNLAKQQYNRIALDKLNINSYAKSKLIKLVLIIHNQLSAPLFRNMILYSWYASGYLKSNPPFKNVNHVCFSNLTIYQTCRTDKCLEQAFIICS